MTRRRDPKTATKIAVFIRKNREKKFPGHGGMTAAATALNVTSQAWSRWESGVSVPDDVNQRKLAEFFGVTLAELRGDRSTPASDDEPALDVKLVEALSAMNQLASLLCVAQQALIDGKAQPLRLASWAGSTFRALDAIVQAAVADKGPPEVRS